MCWGNVINQKFVLWDVKAIMGVQMGAMCSVNVLSDRALRQGFTKRWG